MLFARLDRRDLVADFGGGAITSDAGALLLGATDKAIKAGRPVRRLLYRRADGGARRFTTSARWSASGCSGIALGYEDLKRPRRVCVAIPVLGPVLGRLEARRARCAPLAGKSTLNRLEHAPVDGNRYRKIAHDPEAIEQLFVDLFLDAHAKAPARITLDLGRHGRSDPRPPGRPLLPRRLRRLLLPAALRVLRRASTGGQAAPLEHRCQRGRDRGDRPHRHTHPRALAKGAHPAARRQRLRPRGADGLVRGQQGRLPVRSGPQLQAGGADPHRAGLGRGRGGGAPANRPAGSPTSAGPPATAGGKRRRVVAKAEWMPDRGGPAPTRGSSSPRSPRRRSTPRRSTSACYCAPGDMENRIKECQLDLVADRTSAATMKANQLRPVGSPPWPTSCSPPCAGVRRSRIPNWKRQPADRCA